MVLIVLIKNILSLFLIMGAGIIMTRIGLLKESDAKGLSNACMYIIIPCLIVRSFLITYSDEVRAGFIFAVVLSIVIHVLLILFAWLLGITIHLDGIEQSSLIYSNVGNLVTTLVLAMWGAEWVIYVNAFLIVQTIFLWTHGQLLICRGSKFNIRKIVCNPNMFACVIGSILFLTQVPINETIKNTLESVSTCAGPVCMVMIGILMAGTSPKKMLLKKRTYLVVFLIMIVAPMLMALLLKYTGVSALVENGQMICMILLLCVASPSAVMTTQLAQLFDQDATYAGEINAFTTLSCIVTIPIIISLFIS